MRRRIFHPLGSANPATLIRTLVAHGGVSPRYAGGVALMVLASLLRWPNSAGEARKFAREVGRVSFDPPPVFIVGHWRSGTTYLHNLMSRDPAFCFPTVLDAFRPYDFLYSTFGEMITRFVLLRSLSPTRPMDDVPFNRADLPQEDEIALAAMGVPSFFNCYYFPRALPDVFAREALFEGLTPEVLQQWDDTYRYYLAKLVAREPQRRLLLKNPAHSARIPHLRRLFPLAKFVHIHRDPRAVVKSTGKMYRSLFPLFALQDWDDAALDAYILWAYSQLMDRLFAGLRELPVSDLIEVRYDDLVREPTATVEGIYHALDLGDFARVRPLIDAFVVEASAIRANTRIDAGSDDRVGQVLAPYMTRLGYEAGSASPRQEDVGAPGCTVG